MSSDIAIVYNSVTGTTRQLAESVANGVKSTGVSVNLLEIRGEDIKEGRFTNDTVFQQLQGASAIIFGSPTFMGGVSAQFKSFADASSDLWEEQLWRNKLAAAFTVGSTLSGDQLVTVQYLQVFASQHSMLWVGLDVHDESDKKRPNRLGAQSGLIVHSEHGQVLDIDLAAASYLGQ